MKNILQYFYQIVINDSEINDEGYFFYNHKQWQLKKYVRNFNEISPLLILNNYMLINSVKINTIVLNIKNEPLSFYENMYYVLLKVDYQELEVSPFNMLESPNINGLEVLKRNNWDYLWSSKVDYVEYQIEHLIHKYPILYDTVNYYIGMAENAIIYFKMLDLRREKLYINHRRLGLEKSFFDPCELVIDYKVRDLCEFIKYNFFSKHQSIENIMFYLQKIELSKTEYLLLFVRMLFPSFYFDYYDKIVSGQYEETKILEITKYSKEYERLLKRIYFMIKNYVNALEIPWLQG